MDTELEQIWPIANLLSVPDHGTIVVAGAYEGRYMKYLCDRFPTATVTGYEPQAEKLLKAKARLKGTRAILKNYALGTACRHVSLGKSGTDGASVGSADGDVTGVYMVDAAHELQILRNIDLLLLNCEGSEWALIPYILDEMLHHRISAIAVQFHPDYVSHSRSERVKNYLLEYYSLEYQDTNNWSYWKKL